MKQIKNLLLVLSLATAIFSCKENSLEEQRQNELKILDAYLTKNYPDLEPTKSGLYYKEIKAGAGDTIKVGDRVQIYYATWTIESDGEITLADESEGFTDGLRYDPLEFVVGTGQVIEGLEEAITYLRKGSVANLIIDSGLAYGQNGSATIDPFTSILMQVEVYKVFPAN